MMEEPEGRTDDPAQIAETLRSAGIAPEIIEQAMERGDPMGAVFESVLSPGKELRTVSSADIEARGGVPVDQLAQLISAFGLRVPEPEEPAYTEDEAQAFVVLGQMSEVYLPELSMQVARVYGRMLARIAQTEVGIFRSFIAPRVSEREQSPPEALAAIQQAFATLLPVTDPLLVGVHRRWVEHQVAQAAVRDAETGASTPLPGAVDVAFLFCDLKGFTRYVDMHGDHAGVEAIDRFVEVVTQERGPGFRFTKLLGDGAMLVYSEATEAVEAGARIIAAMPGEELLPVHATVHRGAAVIREGDYFGGTVNLTARLLPLAGADELLATRPVHQVTRERFVWERAGAIRVRGIAGLVELFRLASPPAA